MIFITLCVFWCYKILLLTFIYWQMNMIEVSNTMGIDPKEFDPKTYVEGDTFVTDESGMKK